MTARQSLDPLHLHSWDNPATVRLRKYLFGAAALSATAPVGQARREQVWEHGRVRLYRYRSPLRRWAVPVVLVYALINRPHILDLTPERSLVGFLLERGFEVYLLDWGIPTEQDRDRTIDEHVLVDLPSALAAAKRSAGSDRVSVVGHCQGGTISLVHAALFPTAVENLVLLAAPVDFAPSRPGAFGWWTLWTRQRAFNPRITIDETGNAAIDVPSRLLDRAGTLFGAPAAGLARRLEQDAEARAWLAACRWVDEAVPMAGASFRQWIRQYYQENRLVRGRLQVGDTTVRLADVAGDVLVLAGRKDGVTPLAQAVAALRHMPKARITGHTVDAGHIGLIVGPTAPHSMWAPLARWLQQRSH
ncbi:MAG: alpha/beta fold hydrolase [Actinomycetota bacterium]|nr:alpha/beta fold hydrolase [Actinomycetota bacterium]